MFQDLTALVTQNYFRGDFILVVCTDKDAELQEPFMQIWNFFPEMTAKIYSLQFSLGFTNKLIYEIIEEKILESDILAFHTTNKKGILITDTGNFDHSIVTGSSDEYYNSGQLLTLLK